MKTTRALFFVITCLTLLSARADAQTEQAITGSRSIQVSGKAESILPADRVTISVTLRRVGDVLVSAQEASQKIFEDIVRQLGELGIPPEKVELRNHRLGKEYETSGPDRKRELVGFFSERDFVVELDDASLLEATQQELAGSEDVAVNGTSFSRKDEIEVRKELRRKALVAAREKAVAMAEVYGQKIGKPLKIAETAETPFFQTRNVYTNRVDEVPASGGRVTLSAGVEVVFELLD
ncbi:MAG: SIMPL domain-containing protein [Verrucomicrobiae bacterium]|nr:SIMPL domain-containing protein [Verrucomicrobiae bacterium]